MVGIILRGIKDSSLRSVLSRNENIFEALSKKHSLKIVVYHCVLKIVLIIIIIIIITIIAELWRAKRACGAPWVSKSTDPRKFGNHVTVHRPQPARPSAPQGNQCSITLFSLGAQKD